MGTSNAYSGPVGPNTLLPPWAPPLDRVDDETSDPGDGEAGPDQEDSTPNDVAVLPTTPNPWRAPKDAMTRFARTGGLGANGRRQFRRAARGFVRAQGGAGGATRSSSAGRATARGLGGFLSSAATSGVAAAARQFGLAYVGQDVDAFFVALVDAIAPAGALAEEAVAHAAAAETVEELFEKYAVRDAGLEVLNALTPEAIRDAVERYVAVYINTRLMHVLASRLEDGTNSSLQAYRMERDVKRYIVERVELEFEAADALNIDWSGSEGRQVVDGIFREGFALLERWQ